MTRTLRIAITCGEPAGIGAETVWKALTTRPGAPCEYLLVGPESVWRKSREVAGLIDIPPAEVVAPEGFEDLDWQWGKINPAGALAALRSVELAVRLTLDGEADAIVTAPLTKEGLALSGCTEPGHTELLGRLTPGSGKPTMMFVSKGLKVVLVTTHLPLSDVPRNITRAAVLRTIEECYWGMTGDFGHEAPRIGVAGLNPHAGENGRLGREEIEAIAPAVEAARLEGIDVQGPIPADALFAQAAQGRYDVLVAMYHDQGLAPFKMNHFDDGVNVTLGLPIVRTSPDHGTAFDIAGQGVARPDSMIEAIRWAALLARKRRAGR
jgi:4-hydroxythreonine-4-phosphate dehydrogenase